MNKIDLVSKLLAEENIVVQRSVVPTASFNIATRTLILPIKFNLTETQEMMLILHEVGHALFTTQKYMEFQDQYPQPGFQKYLNVVEDARIERLVKDRYPGCRKDFFNGYNEFHSSDFFGLRGRDVNSMNLIDRINLHFKLGTRIDVTFNAQERVLVRMVEAAKTESDVFDAARAIYEFSSRPENQSKSEPHDNLFDEEDDDFDGDLMDETDDDAQGEPLSDEEQTDGESDADQDGGAPDDSRSDDQSAEHDGQTDSAPAAPEAETQDNFNNLIEDSVVAENSRFFQADEISCDTFVFPAANVVKYIQSDPDTHSLRDHSKFNEFTLRNDNLVNSMVKEFLMKRAAEQYQRSTVAKSGSLDMNRLSQYRIADNIFRKYNITCDATSHGILVLLDWSDSIHGQLHDLIKQVITVVKFCRKVDIKCEVYAFSSNIDGTYRLQDKMLRVSTSTVTDYGKRVSAGHHVTTMIQFMTSSMRKSDFSFIAEKLFYFSRGGWQQQLPRALWLDSTPLMPAVKFAMDYIPAFRQKHCVQKVTMVVLTDGQDNTTRVPVDYYNKTKLYLRDPVTNKFHQFSKNARVQFQPSVTHVLLRMIRERYDYVTLVGFLIFSNRDQLQNCLCSWNIDELPEKVSRGANSSGVHVMETSLFHKMYASRVEANDDILNVKTVRADMTSSQISKIFNKSANSLGKTRVFVKSFIETVS
jgi:hypothetical protein